jgi:hypothetical protein
LAELGAVLAVDFQARNRPVDELDQIFLEHRRDEAAEPVRLIAQVIAKL